MAGQPRKRTMIVELERRAAELDGSTVLEYAVDWVGSGKTLAGLAVSMCESLLLGEEYVTRYMVTRYLNALPGGKQALIEARSEGAHGLADSGLKIVDDSEGADKEGIAAAKSRADFRLRMAGHWNKGEYAPQGNNVNVNIANHLGTQHLDALRRRSVQGRIEQPSLPSGDPDFEVVADE